MNLILETISYSGQESLYDPANYSVGMALFDLLPVILFFLAGLILIRDMYPHLYKGNYALLAAGIIMIFYAGLMKGIWKILVATGCGDFISMNKSFFPIQGMGFLFYGIALLGVLFKSKKGEVKASCYALIPVLPMLLTVYDNNMIFIVGQILGSTLGLAMLVVITIKDNRITKGLKIANIILFSISFLTMLGMGYFSAKLSGGKLEWIAELTNTISQLTLLIGVVILHRNGLKNEGSLDHLKKIEIK